VLANLSSKVIGSEIWGSRDNRETKRGREWGNKETMRKQDDHASRYCEEYRSFLKEPQKVKDADIVQI
jgi:hypothetical protein